MNEGDSMEVSRDGRTLEEARKLVEQHFRNYVGSNAMVVAQEELDWHSDAFKAGFEIESQSDIKDQSMYYVYVWLNRCLIIYLNHVKIYLFISSMLINPYSFYLNQLLMFSILSFRYCSYHTVQL